MIVPELVVKVLYKITNVPPPPPPPPPLPHPFVATEAAVPLAHFAEQEPVKLRAHQHCIITAHPPRPQTPAHNPVPQNAPAPPPAPTLNGIKFQTCQIESTTPNPAPPAHAVGTDHPVPIFQIKIVPSEEDKDHILSALMVPAIVTLP